MFELDGITLTLEDLQGFAQSNNIDFDTYMTNMKNAGMVEVEGDVSPKTRETSWWKGEEGFIPDEFQPGVNRPDIQIDQPETPSQESNIFTGTNWGKPTKFVNTGIKQEEGRGTFKAEQTSTFENIPGASKFPQINPEKFQKASNEDKANFYNGLLADDGWDFEEYSDTWRRPQGKFDQKIDVNGITVVAPNGETENFIFSTTATDIKTHTQQNVQNFIDNNQLSKEDNRKLDNNRYKIQRYINNNFKNEFDNVIEKEDLGGISANAISPIQELQEQNPVLFDKIRNNIMDKYENEFDTKEGLTDYQIENLFENIVSSKKNEQLLESDELLQTVYDDYKAGEYNYSWDDMVNFATKKNINNLLPREKKLYGLMENYRNQVNKIKEYEDHEGFDKNNKEYKSLLEQKDIQMEYLQAEADKLYGEGTRFYVDYNTGGYVDQDFEPKTDLSIDQYEITEAIENYKTNILENTGGDDDKTFAENLKINYEQDAVESSHFYSHIKNQTVDFNWNKRMGLDQFDYGPFQRELKNKFGIDHEYGQPIKDVSVQTVLNNWGFFKPFMDSAVQLDGEQEVGWNHLGQKIESGEVGDYLKATKDMSIDLTARNNAWSQIHLLNIDPSSYKRKKSDLYMTGVVSALPWTDRVWQADIKEFRAKTKGYTADEKIENFRKFANELNEELVRKGEDPVKLTKQQVKNFEMTRGETFAQQAGGFTPMVGEFIAVNALTMGTLNFLGATKYLDKLRKVTYLTKSGKIVSGTNVATRAAKVNKSVTKYANGLGLVLNSGKNWQKGLHLATFTALEEGKMWMLDPLFGTDMPTGAGVGFYLGGTAARAIMPFKFGSQTSKAWQRVGRVVNPIWEKGVKGGIGGAIAAEAALPVEQLLAGHKSWRRWSEETYPDMTTVERRFTGNLMLFGAFGFQHWNKTDMAFTVGLGKHYQSKWSQKAMNALKTGNKAEAEKYLELAGQANQYVRMSEKAPEYQNPVEQKRMVEEQFDYLNKDAIRNTGKPAFRAIVTTDGKNHAGNQPSAYWKKGKDGMSEIYIDARKVNNGQIPHEVYHHITNNHLKLNTAENAALGAKIQNHVNKAISKATKGDVDFMKLMEKLYGENVLRYDAEGEIPANLIEIMMSEHGYDMLVSNNLIGDIAFEYKKIVEKMFTGPDGKVRGSFAGKWLQPKLDLSDPKTVIDYLARLGSGISGKEYNPNVINRLKTMFDGIRIAEDGKLYKTEKDGSETIVSSSSKNIAEQLRLKTALKPIIEQYKRNLENENKRLANKEITKTEFDKLVDQHRKDYLEKSEMLSGKLIAIRDTDDKDLRKNKSEETKDTGWKDQIDRNYTGTHKTQVEFKASPEYGKISKDIMDSPALENMLKKAKTILGVKENIPGEFVENVKFEIIKRFGKNYNPGVINKKFGRALTPWEFLTTGHRGGESRIYRAVGDVAGKFKKQPKFVAADAYEGGYGAFEGHSTETGYMGSSKPFGSIAEQKGIELSKSLEGMQKEIGNTTLGKIIDKKSGADAKNLDWEAKGAKDIVSYKNIKKKAENKIGKEVVVDYYKVSPEMYEKMKKRDDQQLNNEDITSITEVITKDIANELAMIPLWKQVIIDRVTGENVAFDIVAGKFKSEPKVTGTTTSVLKLGQEGGLKGGKIKGLLFNEMPQTGTKGSKYEWSDRFKEYQKSLDKENVKEKFEQDVIRSLTEGKTRAEISGVLKGWMTQMQKALYVQGVNKALPNIPELTNRHTLAEMVNQISAGKSPSLASKNIAEKLVEALRKDKINELEEYAIISGMPEAKEVLDVLMELAMERNKALTTDVDVVKANEKYERAVRDLTEKQWEAENIIAERFIKNVAEKLKLDVRYSDPKWVSKNDPAWREKLEKQAYEEFGYDLDAIDALPKHRKGQKVSGLAKALAAEFGVGNRSRKLTLPNGKEIYLQLEGGTVGKLVKNTTKAEIKNPKNGSWMEKVYSPSFDAVKKALDKIELDNPNKSPEKIAELKIEKYREMASYTGKSKDFEATQEANTRLAKELLLAKLKVAMKNKNKKGLEWLLQDRAIQTNATNGVTKSMFYNMRSVPAFGSGLGEITAFNAKGKEVVKDNAGVRTHWEHALQLLNNTQFVMGIAKRNKSVTPEVIKEVERLIEASQQDLIPKNAQLFNDAAGNTMFSKAFGTKAGVNTGHDALLNVFTNKYARMDNQYIVSGENKGKTLLDVQLETLDINTAKQILSRIPKNKWNVLEYMLDGKVKNSKKIEAQNKEVLKKGVGPKMAKVVASKDISKTIKDVDKAVQLGRKLKKKARGASIFDFDETVGTSENFVIATKGGKTKKIASDKWPFVGKKLVNEGWKMDFSDFNKVTKGKPGPLMQKMKNQIKKYGPDNVFILTARAKESAPAIHEWLKTQGVKIPLENITGLGNSTGEAKAMWMLQKFAEGYNDMYFVDDALPNVKAVKDVLSQLDIKSKVQQVLASKNIGKEVNDIMEHSLNIGSEKVFSKAEAKVRGKDIKRRRFFITDSAADLELLIEPLYGKGKKGIENKKWFDKNFIDPFERGIRDYNTARQNAKIDYMGLRKQNKDVVKKINKEVEGTSFTHDQAMRVYLWNKAGYKIPDLAKTTEAKLVEYIRNNPELQAYADTFAKITKIEKGLKEPSAEWWGETMAGEVSNVGRGVNRKQYLQEWIDVKNEMFSPENLNKMESKLGTNWRENVADIFDRMETGRTRSLKLDKGSAMMIDYLNGSTGTIMNFNTRSAALQTISTLNFLNMRENNPIAAARAMGNVPQFTKDFMKIMNSDMLKQRRDGLQINVSEAELASAAATSKNPITSIIAKILKVGYTPTKLADSFAISFGGATYYRNRIKMYEKQGLSTKEAEANAWTDFQKLSERTQQSSRPDLLSKQQTTTAGRLILPFANTPMQMNRRGMKEILDISKGRYKNTVELGEKMGKVTYYMGAQVALFAGLQSALFAMLLNDDDVSDEKIEKTKIYTANTVADSFLRGMGIQGAVVAGFKNATMEYFKQSEKGYHADYSEVGEDLLNISPLVGYKFSALDRSGDIKKWDKDVPFAFELGNPKLEASLLTIQAITNIPLQSWHQNANNVQHSLNTDYETWQRIHMMWGFTPYNVGIEFEKKKKKKKSKSKGGIKTTKIKTITF